VIKPVRVSTALFVVVVMACAAWAAERVRVTAERVNLRSEPSTDSRIVGKVSKGTVLEVLGREGSWLRVAAPGTGATAYVSASLCVAVTPAPGPQATAPATSEPTAAPGSSAGRSDEGPLKLGVHANWASDSVDFGLGGRVAADIRSVPHLGGLLTLDYFFGGGASTEAGQASVDAGGHSIQLGLYATYSFEVGGVHAYAGGGLSHFRASYNATTSVPGEPAVSVSVSASSTSLGLVAGAKFKKRFFGEARYHFGDASHFTLSAGILFNGPW
jgi:hypothetical protein